MIKKRTSEEDESPETMRKRKRYDKWVVRGGDSGCVVVLAHMGTAHRREPQLPPGIRLRLLESPSSHISDLGPATV